MSPMRRRSKNNKQDPNPQPHEMEMLMSKRTRRNLPPGTHSAGPSTQVVLEERRQSLAERIYADTPHHEAERTVEGDRLLSSRLTAYIAANGPVIDLSSTPLHRRPAVVEAALDAFEESRTGGPCSLCGTATRRPGYFARSTMDQAPGSKPEDNWPNFSNGLCGWCAEFMVDHSEEELLTRVFQLVTGIKGEAFHQALPASDVPHKSTGEAWSHVPVDSLRSLVLKDTRYATHQFVTPRSYNKPQQVPGLPAPYVWDAAPERAKTVLKPSAADIEYDRREREEWAAKKAKREYQAEWERCNRLLNLLSFDHYGHHRSTAEAQEWNRLLQGGMSPQDALDKIKAGLEKQAASV